MTSSTTITNTYNTVKREALNALGGVFSVRAYQADGVCVYTDSVRIQSAECASEVAGDLVYGTECYVVERLEFSAR